MTTFANMVLYIKPDCPYCKKVLDYMAEKSIELPQRDVTDPAVKEELVQIGGKGQVPCLVIDGKKAQYESDDIIRLLDDLNNDRYGE